MSETQDFEYFEGTKTIQHPDGSTTYVTTYHEPYVEPLTPKQQLAVFGITAAIGTAFVTMPLWVARLEEWSDHRKEIRRLKKQKKIEDLKNQTD